MFIDIYLQDYKSDIPSKSVAINQHILEDSLSDFLILKYIDYFGKTFFNRNQMNDLEDDIENCKLLPEEIKSEIKNLINECRNKQNLILIFDGD